MGRPPLAVGTAGRIEAKRDGDGWKCRVHVRDADGKRREVARWAPTKTGAETAVKTALRDRTDPTEASTGITPETRLAALAARWLEDVQASGIATNSKQLYASSVSNHIVPGLGNFQLRELSVPRVDKALRTVAERNGNGSAKTMRSVLSGMIGMAMRLGAMTTNPIRDTATISRATKKDIRALTLDEQDRVMDLPRSDARALEMDIPDLIDFMLGTGMRIGEACAIRDDILEVEGGWTVEINATVIRVEKVGLVVQVRPKTAAGWRVLALPDHLGEMLKRRHSEVSIQPDAVKMMDRQNRLSERSGVRMMFTSPTGQLRDPRNTNRDLRRTLDGIDCAECAGTGHQLGDDGLPLFDEKGNPLRCDKGPFAWVTSHVFRKTVATRLDEAGLSAREIADVLGHSKPSMTQDVYMGRKVVSAAAARILAPRDRALLARPAQLPIYSP